MAGHQFDLIGQVRHNALPIGIPRLPYVRTSATLGVAPSLAIRDEDTGAPLLDVEVWRWRVYRTPTDPLLVELHWRPTQERGTPFFRPTVGPDASIELKHLTAAMERWRLLRQFERIQSKPGPKQGTVKGQKYKTRPDWLAAIRERVLTRPTHHAADDVTIALWLGISPSQLYALMKRWGPPRTLNDLREGNF